MHRIATIGYEGTTVRGLQDALQEAEVELLIDVRAVANSRRPGFAKTRLAANAAEAGAEYLHLRGLGTPADGRAAARAGDYAELRAIYADHLQSAAAQTDLHTLASIVESGRRACLLCFEADPAHCHRTLVANALGEIITLEVLHLIPARDES